MKALPLFIQVGIMCLLFIHKAAQLNCILRVWCNTIDIVMATVDWDGKHYSGGPLLDSYSLKPLEIPTFSLDIISQRRLIYLLTTNISKHNVHIGVFIWNMSTWLSVATLLECCNIKWRQMKALQNKGFIKGLFKGDGGENSCNTSGCVTLWEADFRERLWVLTAWTCTAVFQQGILLCGK